MLEVLRAAQIAELRGEPARRISFRDIDVEQIGYIYEGLLGYSAKDVDEVIVGLTGKKGEEPEIPLSLLERFAGRTRTGEALASAVLNWVKTDQPAAVPPVQVRARQGDQGQRPASRTLTAHCARWHQAMSSCGNGSARSSGRSAATCAAGPPSSCPAAWSWSRRHPVQPPARTIRPSPSPTEVVQHALEPLVYDPGPHQQVDGWVPVDSDRILELKVADIACGSGAFLVAAARYLADRLVEAWDREEAVTGLTPAELKTHAIRTVIANCLYGADINAMAVEMCKLSLWLVSLDPKLPFSFVDDKILHGNSLLGLTDVRQLKRQHIDPDAASTQQTLFEVDVDGVLRQATRLRRATRQRGQQRRPAALGQHQAPPVAPVPGGHGRPDGDRRRGGRDRPEVRRQAGAGAERGVREPWNRPRRGVPGGLFERAQPCQTRRDPGRGLTPTVQTDYDRWKPLHWVIAVPDVMERGGFDAIVGNPPFVTGSDITGAMGTNVRDWLVNVIAGGQRGNADLVAYFFLRALSLISHQGNLGLIATNSIAQGKSREVGLDRMVDDGFVITRSIQSRPWQASATLEYSAVWGTRDSIGSDVPRMADGVKTHRITTLLEPAGRVVGKPARLIENLRIAFEGCKPSGKGFVVEPEQALEWIRADCTNKAVLKPYLNGEDLNSTPDNSATRWIIDFTGLDEDEATRYALPYRHARALVPAQRATGSSAVRNAPWWLFERTRPNMRSAIRRLDEVLVMARHSVTLMPARVPTSSLFGDALAVIATNSFADQAVLSSGVHQMWAICYGSGLRRDPRYTASNVFAGFPRPVRIDGLSDIGEALDVHRREIQLRRQLGYTDLYNLVNDPDYTDDDITRMREIHVALDQAVIQAYGWGAVRLDHGFHTYRRMRRWSMSPVARVEILDLLLEENLRRAAAQGEAPPPADDEDEGEDE